MNGRVIKENRLEILDALHCSELYMSTESNCSKISIFGVTSEDALASNQEEADTKVALHCHHALQCYPEKDVVIRSPSGDIDILVILLSKVEHQRRVYLVSGTGLYREGINLGNIDMDPGKKKCLI